MRAVIDGGKANNNSDTGILLAVGGGNHLEVSVTNSRIDNAGVNGLLMQGGAAYLRNVTITQVPTGISLNASSVVYLSQVQQQAFFGFINTAGISFNGAVNVAFSDNTNHIQGNIVGGSLTSNLGA